MSRVAPLREAVMPPPDCPVAALLEEHRARLLACVERRLSPDLRARLGPDDVLQETYRVAVADYERFQSQGQRISPFVWLYRQAMDRLANAERAARADKRDVGREAWQPDLSSIAFQPVDSATGPVSAAQRNELNQAVHQVLN